jgi:formate dehydrogenase subunit gamma
MAPVNSTTATDAQRGASSSRIVRHAWCDRVFHWVTALSVLVLLGTAFLPILGFRFPWVMAHWITGLIMIGAILFHIVRALFWQKLRAMLIGPADLRDIAANASWHLRLSSVEPPKPGKYSPAQKLIHHSFAIVLLAVAVTGVLMLVRIDSPWWRRNPFWLAQDTWGIVYVVHGLASLILVTMIIAHIYFALRPEKLFFMRAMLVGWITRREYEQHHDPKRWQVDE